MLGERVPAREVSVDMELFSLVVVTVVGDELSDFDYLIPWDDVFVLVVADESDH